MSDQSRDNRDRMPVAEAARVLGISEGAVRKRVERGKLPAEHTPDGRLIVYLDTSATTRDRVRDKSQDVTTERYVTSLEDQVEYLRQQLAEERDANRENRRIIAALTSRIPELPPVSSEATSQEPSGAPERAAEDPDRERAKDIGPTPRSSTGGPQTGTEPRVSWWRRRVFGG